MKCIICNDWRTCIQNQEIRIGLYLKLYLSPVRMETRHLLVRVETRRLSVLRIISARKFRKIVITYCCINNTNVGEWCVETSWLSLAINCYCEEYQILNFPILDMWPAPTKPRTCRKCDFLRFVHCWKEQTRLSALIWHLICFCSIYTFKVMLKSIQAFL